VEAGFHPAWINEPVNVKLRSIMPGGHVEAELDA